MKLTRLYLLFIVINLLLITGGCKHTQQQITILENGYYFNGAHFVAFAEIIINDSVIQYINSKKSNSTGKRINLQGKYVIPGLIDAHVHLSGSPTGSYVMATAEKNSHSSLLCGVTTNIDLFYDEADCEKLRGIIHSSLSKYSSVLLAGPMLTAPGGHGTEYGVATRTMSTAKEAAQITNEVIDNGVDVIKLVYEAYSNKNSLDKETLQSIVTEAHKRGVKVFAHINYTAEAMDCIDAGVDVLAHMPRDPISTMQFERIKTSGIIIIPTISVMCSFHMGYDSSYTADSLLWNTAARVFLRCFEKGVPPDVKYPDAKVGAAVKANLQGCIKHDIPILAGTDAGNYAVFYGYSLHNEIYEYINAGMSTANALNAATSNIGLLFPDMKTSIIKEGFRADLVILNDNPLYDIRHTKSIYNVYHQGKQVY